MSELEGEGFVRNRLEEDLCVLQKRMARVEKHQSVGNGDEVLLEEIREYKEILTCPSCKTNRKDCVLSKCRHMFCYECLSRRYNSRQRKCPKCNMSFAANDFSRVFLD